MKPSISATHTTMTKFTGLSKKEIDSLLDFTTYLGVSKSLVDDAIKKTNLELLELSK